MVLGEIRVSKQDRLRREGEPLPRFGSLQATDAYSGKVFWRAPGYGSSAKGGCAQLFLFEFEETSEEIIVMDGSDGLPTVAYLVRGREEKRTERRNEESRYHFYLDQLPEYIERQFLRQTVISE